MLHELKKTVKQCRIDTFTPNYRLKGPKRAQ